MGKPKIQIKEAKNGKTFVSIKGGNGEKMANTEIYSSYGMAKKAAERIKKIIPGAIIEDKTK